MTQQRDIASLLDLWLAEGSTVAPDRVIDVVTDRIERQRQRGRWRFPTWESRMPARLGLAVMGAALAVLAGGVIYFAGAPRPSVPPQSPRPSPTVAASILPSPSRYILPSGLPYPTARTITSKEFRPWFQLDVPTGWTSGSSSVSFGMTLGLIHDEIWGDSGNLAGSISLRPNPAIGGVGPACPDQRTAPPSPGIPPHAAAIVEALLVDPRFAVDAVPPVVIDGRLAQVLDVRLAPGFTGSCMGSAPSALLLDEPGSFVVLEGDRQVRLILLDVDSIPLVILIYPQEEAFDAFVARAMALVSGITFLP